MNEEWEDKQKKEAEKKLREEGLTFGTALCMHYLKSRPDLQDRFNKTMLDIDKCFHAVSFAAARFEAPQADLRRAETPAEVSNAELTNIAALTELATLAKRRADFYLGLCGIYGKTINMILEDLKAGKFTAESLLEGCQKLIDMFNRGEPPPEDLCFNYKDKARNDLEKEEQKPE